MISDSEIFLAIIAHYLTRVFTSEAHGGDCLRSFDFEKKRAAFFALINSLSLNRLAHGNFRLHFRSRARTTFD